MVRTPTKSNQPANSRATSSKVQPTFDYQGFIDEVLSRLCVEDIYTDQSHQFKQSGDRYRGGCPFHQSKSRTSFVVNSKSKLFWCAGCCQGGSAIDYIHSLKVGHWSKVRGIDFIKALKDLASLALMSLPDIERTPAEIEKVRKWEARRAILQTVIEYGQEILWSQGGVEARSYLTLERGLTEEDIRQLGLGFYLSSKAVQETLISKGYDLSDAIDAGVIWKKLEGYILFPWLDSRSRPLTIYGRYSKKVPPNGKPKTIAIKGEGTKASPLYLDRALSCGHKEIILVEGVLDAALLQVRGDTRVCAYVAACCSDQQIETLKRRSIQSVTLCGDPDDGGKNGTHSNIDRIGKTGITVYVAPKLPDGLDPDEFLIREGLDGWKAHIDSAIHAYTFKAQSLVKTKEAEFKTNEADGTLCDRTKSAIVRNAIAFAQTVTDQEGKLSLEAFFWPTISLALGMNWEEIRKHLEEIYQQKGNNFPGNFEYTVTDSRIENNIGNNSEVNSGESDAGLHTPDVITLGASSEKSLTCKDLINEVERVMSILDPAAQFFELKQLQRQLQGWSLRDLTELYNRQQSGRRGFDPIQGHEFLAKAPESFNWIVDTLIVQGINMLCYADSGVGKSLLFYDLCLSIIKGSLWNGFEVKQGKVLIIQTDEPSIVTGRRLKKLGFENTPADSWHIEQNWQFSQVRQLERWIEQKRPTFVMIDCLSTCNRESASEEKDVAYTLVQNDLMRLADQYQCTIVTLHHENKLGQIRGSTGLPAHVCEVWHLRKKKNEEQLSELQRVLEITKSRTGCSGKYVLELDPTTYNWTYQGDFGEPEIKGGQTVKALSLNWLKSRTDDYWYETELVAQGIGKPLASVRRELRKLTEQGIIESTEDAMKTIKGSRLALKYRCLVACVG
jgi:DNA primase catalytic core